MTAAWFESLPVGTRTIVEMLADCDPEFGECELCEALYVSLWWDGDKYICRTCGGGPS